MPPLTAEQRAQLSAAYKGITVDQRTELFNSSTQVRFNWEPVACKVDIEKRQVTTPVICGFTENLNGWRVLPEEICAAKDSYMARWQVVGRMHTEITNSYPVSCWFDGWDMYITIQVEDDQDWADICNGVYKGTSWAGLAELVEVPPELAAIYGIEAGQWLFNIEMMEDSFVDVPAVQRAVFNAEVGEGSLVDQLIAGTAKSRIRGGKLPAEKQQNSAAPRGGLLGMLDTLMTKLNSVLPGNGQPIPSEDTDMGMTPEEQAKLDQLSQTVETLAASVADLVNAQNAVIIVEEPEADAPPAEDAPEAPAPITIEQLNESIANAVAPLFEKITALENMPAPTGRLREGDGDKPAPSGPAVSSLPANDPARQAYLEGK